MICTQMADCLKSVKSSEALEEEKIKSDKQSKKNKKNREKPDLPYCDYPCNDEERCKKCIVYYDRRKIMVCEERSSRYVLDKEEEAMESICYHVDGGMIGEQDPVRRCDYAFFLKDQEKRLILIELKGTDTGHALEQLSAMVEWETIKEAISTRAAGKLYGRIICSRSVPDIYRNKQRTLQIRFVKFGGNLKIMNRTGEETYRGLCAE